MGFGPREVDRWSLWEYGVLVRDHNAANAGPGKAEPPSSAEHRERMRRHA